MQVEIRAVGVRRVSMLLHCMSYAQTPTPLPPFSNRTSLLHSYLP